MVWLAADRLCVGECMFLETCARVDGYIAPVFYEAPNLRNSLYLSSKNIFRENKTDT